MAAVDNHIHIDLVAVGNTDLADIHNIVVDYADAVDIHILVVVDNYTDLVDIHNNYIHIDIAVADNIDSAAATLMNYNSIEFLGLSWVHFSTLFLWC